MNDFFYYATKPKIITAAGVSAGLDMGPPWFLLPNLQANHSLNIVYYV
jgi:hypothetical protein